MLLFALWFRECTIAAHALNISQHFIQGCGNTMPDLSDLVQFHSGQVENFYLLVLGQVQIHKVSKILINHYEFTGCIENIVYPDQLASC